MGKRQEARGARSEERGARREVIGERREVKESFEFWVKKCEYLPRHCAPFSLSLRGV